MKKLVYDYKQKKRASTLLSIGLSEHDAASALLEKGIYREALTHIYFSSFYISQAILVNYLRPNPSHNAVETVLNKEYGRRPDFPKSYVKLHNTLHRLRNEFSYRKLHSPSPVLVKAKYDMLGNYIKYVLKITPRVEITDILKGIYVDNISRVRDFSFDIYCPKTYSHHNRLTFWQPPFYLDIISPKSLATNIRKLLKVLRVRKYSDYVVGINSKLNQYSPVHIVMLDIDSIDVGIESVLATIGGILLKSGRGFHFIGNKLINGDKEWRNTIRRLKTDKRLKRNLDQKHIKISLARGYSTLRITDSPVKPHIPFFYKEL